MRVCQDVHAVDEAPGDKNPADYDDRQPVHHAEDDAPAGRRSQPAEDDDVHAAGLRIHVL